MSGKGRIEPSNTSTRNDRSGRIPPVAGRFSEGPLTEPTADAQGLVTGTGLHAPKGSLTNSG